MVQTQATDETDDILFPGRPALQDPSAGNNNSEWRRRPNINLNNQPQQPVQPQQEQTYGPPGNAVSYCSTKPSKVASHYGDGFVSSSSHPELGQQYRKAANIM